MSAVRRKKREPGRELVGLVPACGEARRLGALPFSKELYPLALGPAAPHGERGPAPVVEHLLGAMARGGVTRALVVLRPAKMDIPRHLGSGSRLGLDLGYVCLESSPSVPHTLDRAHAYLGDARVVLGYPDIVFGPPDAVLRIVRHQEESGADVVLALFPADRPDKCDLVARDRTGRIEGFVVKDARSALRETWALAVWTSAFTRFLHAWVRTGRGKRGSIAAHRAAREASASDVFADAIAAGLVVEGLPMDGGWYLDIGTPDDLTRAITRLGGEGSAAYLGAVDRAPGSFVPHSSARARKGSAGRRRR